MKASCPLELPPKLLRGARMRPSNRGSILDIVVPLWFSHGVPKYKQKKRLNKLKIGPQQPQQPLTPIGSGRDLHIVAPDDGRSLPKAYGLHWTSLCTVLRSL